MKSKLKSKLRYVAAGIFLLGLIANVSLSLTDPFDSVGTDLLMQAYAETATSGDSGGGTPCDLCVVTKKKLFGPDEVVFSCKSMENESCSASNAAATVSCNNAKEC